jgi:RNA polymerase sigma-70 factor, ECF subfamily
MERATFEKLALEHLDAVYRMAFHLTRNPDAASDLVQDVFLRALKPAAVARFEDRTDETGSGGIRSWLFTICHNVFYSQTKREGRAPAAVGEFYDEQATETLPDEPPPAWDLASFDWEQVDSRLKDAIDELRPDYREVLLLWGVEGLKYREIAEIVGVPIGTVMSRLHRARKVLADQITQDESIANDLGVARLAVGQSLNQPAKQTDGQASPETSS